MGQLAKLQGDMAAAYEHMLASRLASSGWGLPICGVGALCYWLDEVTTATRPQRRSATRKTAERAKVSFVKGVKGGLVHAHTQIRTHTHTGSSWQEKAPHVLHFSVDSETTATSDHPAGPLQTCDITTAAISSANKLAS